MLEGARWKREGSVSGGCWWGWGWSMGSMKVLSYNVRGLGGGEKKAEIRGLV